MTISFITFLIVCPLTFLAGFVDAIGGGGGLISLPAFIIAGIPTHQAIATNKLQACCGTTLTTVRFIKNKLVNLKLAIPTVICAMLGASVGANCSLLVDEKVLKIVLIPVLVVTAFFVMNKNLFGKDGEDRKDASELLTGEFAKDKKIYLIASIAALVIGFYDGFYGPGTGTFLIITLNVFAHFSIKSSNAQAKVINLTTNLSSLVVYVFSGNVIWIVGLAAAVCNMAGNYVGSGLAMKKSDKITRPVIMGVLVLLAVKVLIGN